MNFDIEKSLSERANLVEKELLLCFSSRGKDAEPIFEAQTYSLLGGGKRIRPFLVLTCCHMMGGEESAALPLACAIEMIHTYSLIHDDLPCMDNDDYRRGKLTNHKVFGEATAVLAGDALLTRAFEVIANAPYLDGNAKVQAIAVLSDAAGDCGMIGGQMLDMQAEGKDNLSLSQLERMHALKTGALIRAAAKLGCIAAGCSLGSSELLAADQYAEKIGLAFQVIDDVLDVVGDASLLGKSIGSDRDAGKTTFMSFYSVEAARQYAERLTEEAKLAIAGYDKEGELCALAQYLLERKH